MERSVDTKNLDWPTVVEYFTKRGKPLTEEEIEHLLNEDKAEEHAFKEAEEKKRIEDEKF